MACSGYRLRIGRGCKRVSLEEVRDGGTCSAKEAPPHPALSPGVPGERGNGGAADQLKNRLALSLVTRSTSSIGRFFTIATAAATCITQAGSLILNLRIGSGDRYGASVSTKRRSIGVRRT